MCTKTIQITEDAYKRLKTSILNFANTLTDKEADSLAKERLSLRTLSKRRI